MTRIGWMGAGAMGSRMAGRLLADGHQLTVWNRTAERVEPLRRSGAIIAASPRSAARGAEAVFVMVSDDDALVDVAEGRNGLIRGLSDGSTVIVMCTVGPAALIRLRGNVPSGTGLIDAPVLGTLPEAESGSLSIFLGGERAAIERCEPLLRRLGDPDHVGPLGAGIAAKLVANCVLLELVTALGESLALARGLGLTDDAMWRVIARTPLADQAVRRRPLIENGEYEARFRLPLAHKDSQLIVTAAHESAIDLRLAPAMSTWFADAVGATDSASLDYTAVLQHILAAERTDAVDPPNGPR